MMPFDTFIHLRDKNANFINDPGHTSSLDEIADLEGAEHDDEDTAGKVGQ